jgi:hypothetical protein
VNVAKKKAVKPGKKSDSDLFNLIKESIAQGNYVFTKHAIQRSGQRAILEITALDILEGRPGSRRRRNKRKDKCETGALDWNYCIEGVDVNQKMIRVIVTFEENIMPIITVMWIK